MSLRVSVLLLISNIIFFISCSVKIGEPNKPCEFVRINDTLSFNACSQYFPKGYHTMNVEFYNNFNGYTDTGMLFCYFQDYAKTCGSYVKIKLRDQFSINDDIGIEEMFFTDTIDGYKYHCYDIEKDYLVLNRGGNRRVSLWSGFNSILKQAFTKKETVYVKDESDNGELIYTTFTDKYRHGNIHDIDKIRGTVEIVWLGINRDSVMKAFLKPQFVIKGFGTAWRHLPKSSLSLIKLDLKSKYFSADPEEIEYTLKDFKISFFNSEEIVLDTYEIDGKIFWASVNERFRRLKRNEGFRISDVNVAVSYKGNNFNLNYPEVFYYKYYN